MLWYYDAEKTSKQDVEKCHWVRLRRSRENDSVILFSHASCILSGLMFRPNKLVPTLSAMISCGYEWHSDEDQFTLSPSSGRNRNFCLGYSFPQESKQSTPIMCSIITGTYWWLRGFWIINRYFLVLLGNPASPFSSLQFGWLHRSSWRAQSDWSAYQPIEFWR